MPFKTSVVRQYSPVTIDTVKVSDFAQLNAKFAGDPTSSRKSWRAEVRKTLRSRGIEWSIKDKTYSLFVPKTIDNVGSDDINDYVLVGFVQHDGKTGVSTVTLTHDKLIQKGAKTTK